MDVDKTIKGDFVPEPQIVLDNNNESMMQQRVVMAAGAGGAGYPPDPERERELALETEFDSEDELFIFCPEYEKGFKFTNHTPRKNQVEITGGVSEGKFLSSHEGIADWVPEINGQKNNDVHPTDDKSFIVHTKTITVPGEKPHKAITILVSKNELFNLLLQWENPEKQMGYKKFTFISKIINYIYEKMQSNEEYKDYVPNENQTINLEDAVKYNNSVDLSKYDGSTEVPKEKKINLGDDSNYSDNNDFSKYDDIPQNPDEVQSINLSDGPTYNTDKDFRKYEEQDQIKVEPIDNKEERVFSRPENQPDWSYNHEFDNNDNRVKKDFTRPENKSDIPYYYKYDNKDQIDFSIPENQPDLSYRSYDNTNNELIKLDEQPKFGNEPAYNTDKERVKYDDIPQNLEDVQDFKPNDYSTINFDKDINMNNDYFPKDDNNFGKRL